MPVRRAAALIALGLCSAPQALIVVDGKVVTDWPDSTRAAFAGNSGGLPKSSAETPGFYPNPKGELKALALLVDFSDQAPTFTPAEVEDWLNSEGFDRNGCNGSVRDFYRDISRGQVSITHEVFGFFRAPRPKSYYEGGNGYERAGELVKEVLAHFDAEVDFSLYDNTGDGVAESISIIYAGFGLEWSQGLWPHAGYINERRDGVRLSRYQMTDLGDRFALFTVSHEIGHMVFGWPDLYGFGDYCLMGNASNSTNPVPVNDFFRADQGWIDVVDVDADTRAFFKAEAPAERGYRFINPDRPGELFFWSHVRKGGRYQVLRGSGLLMLHYDQSIRSNNPPNTLCLAVVQADGMKELNATTWPSPGSDAKDFFHAGTKAEWSGTTGPDNAWNDGSPTGLRLFEIGALGDSVSFYVGDAKPTTGLPPSGRPSLGARPGPALGTPEGRFTAPGATSASGRDGLGRRLRPLDRKRTGAADGAVPADAAGTARVPSPAQASEAARP